MGTTRKSFLLIFAVCASLALAACGPNGDKDRDTGAVTDQDAGDTMMAPDSDAGMADSSSPDGDVDQQECFMDDDCDSGEKCNNSGQCVPAGCMDDEDCGDDKVCDQNAQVCVECVETDDCDAGRICNTQTNKCEAAQCQGVGQDCDPSKPSGSGFECVDAGKGPKCMAHCGSQEDCSGGSVCLPAENTQDAQTVCYTSQCNGPADLSACSGNNFNGANHAIFQGVSSFKCATLVNNANLCVPAGQQQAGDACTATSPVEGLFCQPGSACTACQSGNTCVSGTCKPLCQNNASNMELQCSNSNETCIGGSDSDVIASNAGFCDEKCDAYSRGQCSNSSEGCIPLDNQKGYCTTTGQKGFMEACQPPTQSNPQRNDCKEGMQCITFQEGGNGRSGLYRCLPICNAPGPNDLNPQDNNATCGGTMYGRFAYLGSSPANLDVYVDGNKAADNLAPDAVTDADGSTAGSQFFEYMPGELNVKAVDGSQMGTMNPVVDEKPFVTSGMVKTWAVTPESGGLSLQAIDVPRGVTVSGSGKAKIRAVHLVPDFMSGGSSVNVDVVAVGPSGSIGDSSNLELAKDAAYGDAGSFMEVDGGTAYTIWVFPKGATRSSGMELAKFTGVSVPAGEIQSVYLKGTMSTGRAVATIPYSDAAPAPDYTCWSSSQNPSPASGICFQGCEPEDYGQDTCFSDQNGCRPLGSDHLCMPEGDKKVGESCDPGAFQDCEAGNYCQQYGDGSGVCRSFCEGGGSSNTALQCGSSTTCSADQGSFGQCQQSCSPDNNFADTSCPQNLQTCIPESENNGMVEGAYCSASDGRMKGQTCGQGGAGSLALQNCQPGQVCAYDTSTAQSPFQGIFELREDSQPTCKERCDLFSENSGCPDGYSCGVDIVFTGSAEAGVCLKDGQGIQDDPAGLTNCGMPNVGTMCGPNSHCILTQGRAVCYRFCDWATKEGCKEGSGNTCQPFSGGPIGGLGICAPPQN